MASLIDYGKFKHTPEFKAWEKDPDRRKKSQSRRKFEYETAQLKYKLRITGKPQKAPSEKFGVSAGREHREGLVRHDDNSLSQEQFRGKADSRVGVNDDAVLEGKTRKKLRKSEQLRAQRRSKRRLRVGGNLSIGTKGISGVGTGGSTKSSLNIPKG